MWIGLLGSLVVRTDTAELRIAARNERAVLAALAVAHGRVVSADVIAEVIWNGRPPASWPAMTRMAVSGLRRRFGAADRGGIITAGSGYRLRDAGIEIDMASFEAGCADGHAAADAGNWAAAAARLRETLTLWRGAPFADIHSSCLQDSHAAYLTEVRVAALMRRAEADLRLAPCRAAFLVPELYRLSGEYPLNERFRSQLMLALYRTGRQSDALAEYRASRQALREELGVEPSRELADMQQRILRRDPLLELWPPSHASHPAASRRSAW